MGLSELISPKKEIKLWNVYIKYKIILEQN